MHSPPVFFYLPEADVPPFDHLPGPDELARHPRRFLSPALNWVWRTYHHLSSDGFPCRLVHTLPDEGLIVSAACNLPLLYRPTGRQFIVSCVADSPPRFFAPCQLFQSATQAAAQSDCFGFPSNLHLPHWPQPGLLPRNPDRADTFRHLDYFGAPDQLAPELRSLELAGKLRALNLELRFNFEHYHDYRTTDFVIGVRSFGPRVVTHKPASKLINAWLAGVPSILGPENAFRELRTSSLDFIEVNTLSTFLEACTRLRDDLELRAKMISCGHLRGRDYTNATLTLRWRTLLAETLPPLQARWSALPEWRRELFFAERSARRFSTSLARRCRLVSSS